MAGSRLGAFPTIVATKRATVVVSVRLPHVEPGSVAVVRAKTGGDLLPFGRQSGRTDTLKVMTVPVDARNRVGFRYKFGDLLHDQRLEVRAGSIAAELRMHLHLDGDDHGEGPGFYVEPTDAEKRRKLIFERARDRGQNGGPANGRRPGNRGKKGRSRN